MFAVAVRAFSHVSPTLIPFVSLWKTAVFCFWAILTPTSAATLTCVNQKDPLTRPDWTEPPPAPPQVAQQVSECGTSPAPFSTSALQAQSCRSAHAKMLRRASPRHGRRHRRKVLVALLRFCRGKRTDQDHFHHRSWLFAKE